MLCQGVRCADSYRHRQTDIERDRWKSTDPQLYCSRKLTVTDRNLQMHSSVVARYLQQKTVTDIDRQT